MSDTQQPSESPRVEPVVKGLVDCAKCGHSNAQGIRYCDNCGASLAGIAPTEKKQEASSDEKPGLLRKILGRK